MNDERFNVDITWVFEDIDGLSLECTLNVLYSYTEGKLSGPPEDCYPADSELDIIVVSVDVVICAYGEVTPVHDTLNELIGAAELAVEMEERDILNEARLQADEY